MKKNLIPAIVVVGALAFTACASSDPTTSDEYVAVEADLDSAMKDRAAVEDDLTAANSEIGELEKALASARADADAARQDADTARSDAEDATAEADALRLKYDPEIRAELMAVAAAEVTRACGVAITDFDAPIAGLVEFDAAWEAVITEAELVAQVEECAAPERSKTAEEREAARFDAYGYLSVDEVVKNPAAYEGLQVVAFADIVQWDANTGTCAFHANFLGERGGRYDYNERGQFVADSLVCPQLDGIDQDDIVKIWVTGTGSVSYATSVGGTNTVPTFQIDKIELLQKN